MLEGSPCMAVLVVQVFIFFGALTLLFMTLIILFLPESEGPVHLIG